MAPGKTGPDKREMLPGDFRADRREIASDRLLRDRLEIDPGETRPDRPEMSPVQTRPVSLWIHSRSSPSEYCAVDEETGWYCSRTSDARAPVPNGACTLTAQ